MENNARGMGPYIALFSILISLLSSFPPVKTGHQRVYLLCAWLYMAYSDVFMVRSTLFSESTCFTFYCDRSIILMNSFYESIVKMSKHKFLRSDMNTKKACLTNDSFSKG